MKILKTTLLSAALVSLLTLTSGCIIEEEVAAESAGEEPAPYVPIRERNDRGGGDGGGGGWNP